MKKNNLKSLLFISVLFCFVSCASTPTNDSENAPRAPREIGNKLSAEDSAFLEKLNQLNFTVIKSPKETKCNKAFASDFVFAVTDSEGNPVADYAVTLTCPSVDDEVTVVNGVTDSEGKFTYTAEVPVQGNNAYVTFAPATASTQKAVLDAVEAKTVKAPYKVKGTIADKGAILFVWDFNEKDRALNDSYEILATIRNRGITMAGNAPVSDSSYFNRPVADVYKLNKDIVGNAYGYLIIGTIKFIKPVEQVENEYLCSLVADIKVVRMSDGEVAYSNVFTNEAYGSSWTKCTSKCKSELANKIIEEIIYNNKL